jgi:hypothetical protein
MNVIYTLRMMLYLQNELLKNVLKYKKKTMTKKTFL